MRGEIARIVECGARIGPFADTREVQQGNCRQLSLRNGIGAISMPGIAPVQRGGLA
jgi:hypothetical protein